MRLFTFVPLVVLAACFLQYGIADPLAVSEDKMPALKNQKAPFRGVIKHDGYTKGILGSLILMSRTRPVWASTRAAVSSLRKPTAFGSVCLTFVGPSR